MWPLIFDIEGPSAFAGFRNGMIRKSFHCGPWDAAIAIEQPFSDVTLATGFERHTPAPDFIARLGLTEQWGNIQLAHVSRLLGARDSATQDVREYDYGWGLSLTTKLNTVGKSFAQISVTGGTGVARYMEDGLLTQSSAAVQDATGSLTALDGFGAWGGYTHYWCDHWYTTALWGHLEYENSPLQAPDAFASSEYGAINLVWTPVQRFIVGIEFLYGERTNFDGATGVAHRMTIGSQITF
jgi:hypothetical protein